MIGILAGVLSALKMGKDLDKDPEFLEKMKDPAFAAALDAGAQRERPELPKGAKLSVGLFGAGVLLIILIGSFRGFCPTSQMWKGLCRIWW